MLKLHFYVYRAPLRPKPVKVQYPAIFLFDDNWDDYGFTTLYRATIQISKDDPEFSLGELKILQTSPQGDVHHTKLPNYFTELKDNYCSLGQSVRYYRHLKNDLTTRIRRQYAKALRDVVASVKLRKRFEGYKGFKDSLLRHIGARDAYKRGGFYIDAPFEDASPPNFLFQMQLPQASNSHEITFDFSPHEQLPHRTILLIGRNGTGKTQILAHLAHALYGEGGIRDDEEKELAGTAAIAGDEPDLSKIIAISYSAFDQFPIPADKPSRRGKKTLFSYKYCGLRNAAGIIDVNELKTMLDDAIDAIEREDREDIFERLCARLLAVDLAKSLTGSKEDRDEVFLRLSAGQRFIVALTADILGFIEPQSMVLVDEPETHLHPGLLSTLIAILDEILREYQSFAVIATHSPILLQQIPSRYVRVIRRHGDTASIKVPSVETFGEDLGELTRKILDLAEPEKDFHSVLDALVERGLSVKQIESMFENGVPLPVQIYLDSISSE